MVQSAFIERATRRWKRERDGSEILNIFFLNKYWHHQVYGGTVSFLSKECDEKILLHLSHNIYHSWRGMRIKKK
jgi:hypothetical protein